MHVQVHDSSCQTCSQLTAYGACLMQGTVQRVEQGVGHPGSHELPSFGEVHLHPSTG